MSDRELPARPNLEHYKKQAKDLAKDCTTGIPDAIARVKRHHPRFHKLSEKEIREAQLTDAQLVIAREHGFESWPRFAKYIDMVNLISSVASLEDPVAAFIEVACVPRHSGHRSGTLDHADMILSRYPQVAAGNIHTAAILADEAAVRSSLARDPKLATVTGGPHGWDALTHLCFSRYLRVDKSRSEAFVRTARLLLDAGASANTGWFETIDQPTPRPSWESAIYGAAGLAQHPELTRLLLEYGADPNDEETPYHVPEGYDNTVMEILLESGQLNDTSLTCMLLRKTDWHDEEGIRLVLEHGGDPNMVTKFGDNALHHALRRDNRLTIIELLLDHGANPAVKSAQAGKSAVEIAVRRGRGDVLTLLEQRGIDLTVHGVDRLIAACARADRAAIDALVRSEPQLVQKLIANQGMLLAEFAGNGNADGLRCLLEVGANVSALYKDGDPYFDIAKHSTALHVAAWRAWTPAVKLLLERGAPVNARDGRGRTPLALAVKASVDSYWTDRRSPDSVKALLDAGATTIGIKIPSGYDEVDELLRKHAG
ncbi:MAG TPA: ankyrin repeat domain-containing protein [Terriglobales bacterium]|nr:ankyrin repeat domain-containing protein [Terriglobales bacterium]